MQKVVLCIPLEPKEVERIEKIKNAFLTSSAIDLYLVHCFEIQVYTYEFAAAYYPTEGQLAEIQSATKDILDNVGKKIKSKLNTNSKVNSVFLSSTNPKAQIVKYLKDIKADCVVVATTEQEGIKGLFHSSFADYMNHHAPCDVLVLRP
jgi:nucleotide-binding universal stress UspA family protein